MNEYFETEEEALVFEEANFDAAVPDYYLDEMVKLEAEDTTSSEANQV